MYFKIKKANDLVIYLVVGPSSCKKWHTTTDRNEIIDGIKCFARLRQSKCKSCSLAHTIEGRTKRHKEKES